MYGLKTRNIIHFLYFASSFFFFSSHSIFTFSFSPTLGSIYNQKLGSDIHLFSIYTVVESELLYHFIVNTFEGSKIKSKN
ncbi:hypothetical protein BD770DRAFT_397018 [Pilaira anomala]|nr:hypothetical protein BD770DRAFT_397018 [Pilaira anomala]